MKIKQFIILALMIAVCSTAIQAQKTNSPYLFSDFMSAKVYFSNGRQSDEKVNYHLLSNKIRFIDRKDQQIKEVSDPQIIDSIKIGNRTFIPNPDEGWIEILSTAPLIQVQYLVNTKTKGQIAAYGGTSELSNTKSYSAKKDNENISIVKDVEFEVSSYYNYYWITIDGKRKQFKSFAQFLKFFPKQKDTLNQYIQDNHISFEDTEAIVKLCLYAESL